MEVVTQRLDHRRAHACTVEGYTCAELVEQYAPPIDRAYVVVLLNGIVVPRECWARVKPRAHTTVVVAVTLAGGSGEGEKNPLLLIASIAIAVFAPYAAVALGGELGLAVGTVGALTTTGSVLAAGIGMVANLALAAIFKPSKNKFAGSNASTDNAGASPTYSLQGQSNLLDAYGPVRRVFGLHRIFPVIIGRPYIEVVGDDQYLVALYDVGAGDYEVTDVRVGASHINYFQGASYTVHRNTKAPALAWYWGVRHGDQYNLKLDGNWQYVDTVHDAGGFIVSFVFPTGIASIDQTNGKQKQNAVLFAIEFSDYGVGNWRALETAYGWASSRPITLEQSQPASLGNWGDPLRTEGNYDVRGYPAGATAIILQGQDEFFFRSAGNHFIYNGTKYTILNFVDNTPRSINISPPLQTEIITQVWRTDPDGDPVAQYVEPQTFILYSEGGEYEVIDSRVVQLALAITVRPEQVASAGKRYTIRARQLGGFGDDRTTFGNMALVGVTTLNAVAPVVNLRNEHTMVEIRIKANDQVSGTLDELSCFAHSYLWVYRSGIWSYELSRSPAWALYEVLTGKMNKRPLSQSKIDLNSFEAWANYCGSTHPSTNAPRGEFDHVVDYNTTLFALAQTVTAAGRATLTPGDGLYRIIIDEPKATPIQVFTPHNSKSFSGTRTFIEPPHAFRAKFLSRDTWRMEEQVVYNDGYSAANATIFEVIELPGVTRPGQVWCDARYRMAQGIHRQEVWSLDVDLENLVCTRGDLVHVAHDVPQLGGLPARIKDVTYDAGGLAVWWVLTEPLDLQGTPHLFGYTVRSLDGVIHQGQFSGQTDPYTVAPQIPVAGIRVGDLHVWGAMTRVTYPFLLSAINPQPNLAASLTLLPYAGGPIFGADAGTIPPYVPVVDADLGNLAPPPIAHVSVLQALAFLNRRPLLTVSFQWLDYVAPTFVAYEIWLDWSLNTTGGPQLLGRSTAPHFEWLSAIDLLTYRNYPGSTFCVKVLGVNAFGSKRTLAETPATCDTLIGDYQKPAAPPYFELDLKRDTITLNWEHPGEPDIDFYEIRYDPNIEGANFGQSTIVSPQIPYPTRSFDVPARLGTYFIKTIDTSGNRSDEFASAFTPGENIWQLNAVAVVNDQPINWPGVKSNFVLNGAALETVEVAPGEFARRAEYYYADLYDGGEIYQTRFTSKITAYGKTFTSIMARWIPLSIAVPIAGAVVLDSGQPSGMAAVIDVWHEIRWVNIERAMSTWLPLASAVPIGFSDADFGAWRRFQVGDYTGQKFQFRLIAEYTGPDVVADVGVAINSALIEIDMTDRIDGEYDILCPVGGVRVNYLPAFRARPVLGITGDNVTVGDTHTITAADATGFNIEFFNGAASVARQFDWLASGYGRRSVRIVDGLAVKGTRKPATFINLRRAA